MHRIHDYRALIQRWRAVAQRAGLRLRRLVGAGPDAIFYLQTPALADAGGIYVSAGIHGDEPAGPEALIVFAEKHAARMAAWPLLLLPCLNPWGLKNNRRSDARGLDLNRIFHDENEAMPRAVKAVVGARQFAAGLMLHEDYDGEGLYLYELQRQRPFLGEALLKVGSRVIPLDPRKRIDRRKAHQGLIRRHFEKRIFAKMGYPEAIWLQQLHARHALTIETPSEFALAQRVRAHVAILEECVRRFSPSPAAKR